MLQVVVDGSARIKRRESYRQAWRLTANSLRKLTANFTLYSFKDLYSRWNLSKESMEFSKNELVNDINWLRVCYGDVTRRLCQAAAIAFVTIFKELYKVGIGYVQ